MDLGHSGWLSALIVDAVQSHSLERPKGPWDELPSGRARARSYLRQTLRSSGLLYGTPEGRVDETAAPEEQLFIAVLRTFARMGLDLGLITEAPVASRKDQLLTLFAALTGQFDDVEGIQELLKKGSPATRRQWSKVEAALAQRAMSIAGDPAYGVVLHNGAVYADAQLFGRHAIELFSRGRLQRAAGERRQSFSARQKALLVEVLTALAVVERKPSFATRRAILRQIEDLQLPSEVEGELRTRVKRAFERQPSLATIVKEVRSSDLKQFILEQTLLASLVDGRRLAGELAFLRELAAALKISPLELQRIELQMAEFYAKNRSVVDVFTLSAAAGVMGEEMVSSMQDVVEKNFNRLMKEVKETGELSVLLTRAARGQKLSSDERKRMREQLIDVAKVVPALAIFAAPGGLLLLIALAKVLKFNLLPSSFRDDDEDDRG